MRYSLWQGQKGSNPRHAVLEATFLRLILRIIIVYFKATDYTLTTQALSVRRVVVSGTVKIDVKQCGIRPRMLPA